jgi:hypothetical protein
MKRTSNRMTRKALAALAFLLVVTAAANAQAVASFEAEVGAIKLLQHSYRVGPAASSTTFDFVEQGGQEILFPFDRYTAFFTLGGVHQLRFLYQPLEISTTVDFPSAVVIDGKSFSGPTRMVYGFPFYRLSYYYKILSGSGSWLAPGLALQLRNASIRFESLDGSELAVSQNLGLVPALALAGRLNLGQGWFAAFDATGIYASSALINGADFQFEGSILDASARIGFAMREGAEVFLNARFFGGSAAGVSQYERTAWSNSASPETENRISAVTLTIGSTIR